MKDFLLEIFAWWRGNTWGTRLWLWRHGSPVGTDELGNRYFKSADGKRRFVVYNGPAEASAITPAWHGWMHHRTDLTPSEEAYQPRRWQTGHAPNLTGTALAYRPDGSLLNTGERPKVSADYEAWSPE